ncbi:MAG: exonuclease SbcCD subunit D [Bacilli bacterium]
MKFIHISDLHLGKKLNAFSLMDDHSFYLTKLIEVMKKENVHLLLISGDVFDNYNPSNETLSLLDDFFVTLKNNDITALIISGNHDSGLKLHYLSSFLKDNSIYVVTNLDNFNEPIKIEGVNFYLIPYVNVDEINYKFSTSFKDIESAYRHLIDQITLNESEENVLLAHQTFIPMKNELERSGSEDIVVGMIPNISTSVISKFDYAALGHIHKTQKVASNAYYCGAPLVYHKDEVNYQKDFLLVEINNHQCTFKNIPFEPYRKVRLINDYFSSLNNYSSYKNDYIYFVLKDKNIINNAINKIKLEFPYALSLEYEMNSTIESSDSSVNFNKIESKDISEIFSSFYASQNGEELTKQQLDFVLSTFMDVKKKYEAD